MTPVSDADVNSLAPYENETFREGMARLMKSPVLPGIVKQNFPKLALEEFVKVCLSLEHVDEFHEKIIKIAIRSLLRHTSSGLTTSGYEKLNNSSRRVFISNHRDIICDPALFAANCVEHGGHTPKVLLGDNLLVNQFVTDLVKVNKGVTVKRNLSTRELFRWSQVLSTFIRREIENGPDSIWIAQREGRAKDGNDETHPGVVKMLTMSSDLPFVDAIAAMHVTPVAISYEYDPCDALKAREVYLTATQGSYKKAPGEDVLSMGLGIQGFKGLIHIGVGDEITAAVARARQHPNRKEQVAEIVGEIDRQILKLYCNFTSNYIAYDLAEGKGAMSKRYTPERKEEFLRRMDRQVAALVPPPAPEAAEGIRKCIIEAYANPLRNSMRVRA